LDNVFTEAVKWEPPGIPLAPYSLKNKRRIFWAAGAQRNVPSAEAAAWLKNAALLWRAYRTVEFDAQDALQLEFVVRYPDHRRDFVGALDAIADALQAAGVVHNDRAIRAVKGHVVEETGSAMTWVRLERIGELPWRVEI
jgi:hypothetical protein